MNHNSTLESNSSESNHKKKRSNSTPSQFFHNLNQYRISTWKVRSKRPSNANNNISKPQKNVFPTVRNSLYQKPSDLALYSHEITQFQSIIQNINQQLRDLYLSTQLIEQFNGSLNTMKTIGINQLKSNKRELQSTKSNQKVQKTENTKFSHTWNAFIDDFQQTVIETPSQNLFSSYLESSLDLIKKDFDVLSRYPPQSSSFKKQWDEQFQLFTNKLNEINHIILSEQLNLPLLGENFEDFLNQLNDTYLFKRTSLAMAKRDALQLSMKQTLVNILKFKDQILNDQNDKNIMKVMIKINSYISQLEQLFADTEEDLILSFLTNNNSNRTTNNNENEIANENDVDNQVAEEEEEEELQEQPQANVVPPQLKSARNYNKLFKKKLEIAQREEEALTAEVAEKEQLINSTRDLLKKLSPDPKESVAVQRRNEAKKKKESIEKNVNSLKSEIKRIEKQIEVQSQDYSKLQRIKQELREAQIENEYLKSIKSANSKYLKRLTMYTKPDMQEKPIKAQTTKLRESKSMFLPSSKPPNNIIIDDMIKKLQAEWTLVKTDYELLVKERSLDTDHAIRLMYYDAQRIQQQNVEFKEELQGLQLQNINIGKEREIDQYLKTVLQAKKKQLREINEPLKIKTNGYFLNKDLLAERNDFDSFDMLTGDEKDAHSMLKKYADSLMKMRLNIKKQIERQTETIRKYNETMKKCGEAELAVMIQKRRLEQLHIDFDYNLLEHNEKMEKMRELTQQKVEVEEKIKEIESIFYAVFGDRILYNSKMTLLDQIDFVTKQFHKSK